MGGQQLDETKQTHGGKSGESWTRRAFLTGTLGGTGAMVAAGMLGKWPIAGAERTVTAAAYGSAARGGLKSSCTGAEPGGVAAVFASTTEMRAAVCQAGALVRTMAYDEGEGSRLEGGAWYRIMSAADYALLRGNSDGPDGEANGAGFIDHPLSNGLVAVLAPDGPVDLSVCGLERGESAAMRNAQALQAALRYPLERLTATGIYTFAKESVADLGQDGLLEITGNARFRLAAGAIVNTDADYRNHQAILRVQGGRRFAVRGITFDGNRDGQTYPVTRSSFGRGTVPRRTNGLLEVCPSQQSHRPQTVIVEQCRFEHAYLSGAMFIQCGDCVIQGNSSANNTINGFGGAGFATLLFESNTSDCDGWSDVYGWDRYEGDRAQLQLREWPKDYTAATEGIPVIAITESERNGYVVVRGNQCSRAGVIGLFLRACEQCVVADNVIRDIGYKRMGGSYSPTAIWCDFGQFLVTGNDIRAEAVRSEDMKPDGIRIVGMEGVGIDRPGGPWMPMRGEASSVVADNRIVTIQPYNGGAPAAGPTLLLHNKGIIVTSFCSVRGNVIEGCLQSPIEAINDTNFGDAALMHVEIADNTICRTAGDSVINLRNYGTTSGAPTGLSITGNTIFDVRSETAGADARQMVQFSPAWTAREVRDVRIAANRFDCSNRIDPSKAYTGVRFRGSAASRGIVIADNVFADTLNAVRTESFSELLLTGNIVRNGLRLLYANLAAGGMAGRLVVSGSSCSGIAQHAIAIQLGATSYVLQELVAEGNVWSGSGGAYAGVNPGTSPVRYMIARNLDGMAIRVEPRRSFTGTPAFDAQYVGECLLADDGAAYIAVQTGTGAGDWRTL